MDNQSRYMHHKVVWVVSPTKPAAVIRAQVTGMREQVDEPWIGYRLSCDDPRDKWHSEEAVYPSFHEAEEAARELAARLAEMDSPEEKARARKRRREAL